MRSFICSSFFAAAAAVVHCFDTFCFAKRFSFRDKSAEIRGFVL